MIQNFLDVRDQDLKALQETIGEVLAKERSLECELFLVHDKTNKKDKQMEELEECLH